MEKLVIIESVDGKYGPQVKSVDGSFYSFSKYYKGPTVFEPGTVLSVDVYTTGKGGKYLNKADILSQEPIKTVSKPEPLAMKKASSKPVEAPKTSKSSEAMTKAEWGAKDRSQLIGGLSHDAATLAAVVLNMDGSNEPGTESALRVYKTLLEGMLLIREQVK